jgi:hypothetical protein
MTGQGLGTGSSFYGAMNYLEKDERAMFRESENLPGFDRNQDIRLMERTAQGRRSDQPVYHFEISYNPADEDPTKEQMLEDMRRVLKKLGLEDHQAMIVGHDDKDHLHVHGIVNRYHPDKSRAFNPWQDTPEIIKELGEIEKERGYELVSALPKEAHNLDRTRATMNELKHGQRIGSKAIQERADITAIFKNSASWNELENNLRDIRCEIKTKGRGGVIHDPVSGQEMKLSRVGKARKHSWKRLNERFGKFEKCQEARKRAQKAEKIVSKHFDSEAIQKAFGKTARAQFGSKQAKKKAGKAFKNTLKETLKRGYQVKGAIKGFTALASSSNPIGTVASMGLKFAKGISKQLEQQRDRGMGR